MHFHMMVRHTIWLSCTWVTEGLGEVFAPNTTSVEASKAMAADRHSGKECGVHGTWSLLNAAGSDMPLLVLVA